MTNTIKMPAHGIKINDENKELIEAYLKSINGRANTWAVTSYEKIDQIAIEAEKMLNRKRLNDQQKNSAQAVYYGDCPWANAYRNAVTTTFVQLKRYSEGWRLIYAEKNYMYPKNSKACETYLRFNTEMAEEIKRRAINAAMCDIEVIDKESV